MTPALEYRRLMDPDADHALHHELIELAAEIRDAATAVPGLPSRVVLVGIASRLETLAAEVGE